jgi:putative membrane protein insertion efficiency factor
MNWADLPRRALIMLVRGYRLLLSPWLGSQCRFEPTCSVYALDALHGHGAAGGSYLAVRRLLRCHPWCAGGHDPVPRVLPGLFPWHAQDASPPAPPPTSSKTSS